MTTRKDLALYTHTSAEGVPMLEARALELEPNGLVNSSDLILMIPITDAVLGYMERKLAEMHRAYDDAPVKPPDSDAPPCWSPPVILKRRK